ncbi:small integral membrane protein 19-like [Lytechinus pictus]|uniref:small integral membrane protein 19-like n=1 Tax=Lytechinus variegatus TaxID=7654 RepID=UPI001BB23732|nr:small integral membrane protein 19-like [Lytechinus variegatus]XP_041477436.1 small integral membrane protein 19-like [Lytechinus variegatus]XP_054766589.1 small integral membrane protein 19-like [Lytechinus pictus]
MAHENHGLPPEEHIDHWNEATNIYMVVIVVSLWFFFYVRKNKGKIVRMLTMKKTRDQTDLINSRYKEELQQVRLRQQLESYYISRKWDQGKPVSQEHHINLNGL